MAGRSTSPGSGFVKPDSVLAQTAHDLVAAHTADGGRCRCCGSPAPCAPAQAAAQVLAAAGMRPTERTSAPIGPNGRSTAWEAPPRAEQAVVLAGTPDIPYRAGSSPAA